MNVKFKLKLNFKILLISLLIFELFDAANCYYDTDNYLNIRSKRQSGTCGTSCTDFSEASQTFIFEKGVFSAIYGTNANGCKIVDLSCKGNGPSDALTMTLLFTVDQVTGEFKELGLDDPTSLPEEINTSLQCTANGSWVLDGLAYSSVVSCESLFIKECTPLTQVDIETTTAILPFPHTTSVKGTSQTSTNANDLGEDIQSVEICKAANSSNYVAIMAETTSGSYVVVANELYYTYADFVCHKGNLNSNEGFVGNFTGNYICQEYTPVPDCSPLNTTQVSMAVAGVDVPNEIDYNYVINTGSLTRTDILLDTGFTDIQITCEGSSSDIYVVFAIKPSNTSPLNLQSGTNSHTALISCVNGVWVTDTGVPVTGEIVCDEIDKIEGETTTEKEEVTTQKCIPCQATEVGDVITPGYVKAELNITTYQDPTYDCEVLVLSCTGFDDKDNVALLATAIDSTILDLKYGPYNNQVKVYCDKNGVYKSEAVGGTQLTGKFVCEEPPIITTTEEIEITTTNLCSTCSNITEGIPVTSGAVSGTFSINITYDSNGCAVATLKCTASIQDNISGILAQKTDNTFETLQSGTYELESQLFCNDQNEWEDKNKVVLSGLVVCEQYNIETTTDLLTTQEETTLMPTTIDEETTIEPTITLSTHQDEQPIEVTTMPSTLNEQTTDETTFNPSTLEDKISTDLTSIEVSTDITTINDQSTIESTLMLSTIDDETTSQSTLLPTTSEDEISTDVSTTESTLMPSTVDEETTIQSTLLPTTSEDELSTDISTLLPSTIEDETTIQSTLLPTTSEKEISTDVSTTESTLMPSTVDEDTTIQSTLLPTTSEDEISTDVSTTESTLMSSTIDDETTIQSTLLPTTSEDEISTDVSTIESTSMSSTIDDETTILSTLLPTTSEDEISTDISTVESTLLPSTVDEDTTIQNTLLPTTSDDELSTDVSTIESTLMPSTVDEDTTIQSTLLPTTSDDEISTDVSTMESTSMSSTIDDETTILSTLLPTTSENELSTDVATTESTLMPSTIDEETTIQSTSLPTTSEDEISTDVSTSESTLMPSTTDEETTIQSTLLPTTSENEISTDISTVESTLLPSTVDEDTTIQNTLLPTTSEDEISTDVSTIESTSMSSTIDEETTILSTLLPTTSEDEISTDISTVESTLLPSTVDEDTTIQSTLLPTTSEDEISTDASTTESSLIPSTIDDETTIQSTLLPTTSEDEISTDVSTTESTLIPSTIDEETTIQSTLLPTTSEDEISSDLTTIESSTELSTKNDISTLNPSTSDEEISTQSLTIDLSTDISAINEDTTLNPTTSGEESLSSTDISTDISTINEDTTLSSTTFEDEISTESTGDSQTTLNLTTSKEDISTSSDSGTDAPTTNKQTTEEDSTYLTTISQTTDENLTTPSQCNIPNGIWGEWRITLPCSDSCGSCGHTVKKRACLSESFNVPCVGDSEKVERCNHKPCTFPRLSCCHGLKAHVFNKTIVCDDTVAPDEIVDLHNCCPEKGIWGEWENWSSCQGSTCGGCGSITRTRKCLSEDNNCPCEGDDTETDSCKYNGEWSEWNETIACSDDCGQCGVRTFERVCLTTGTCACSGSSIKTEKCGFTPCIFPRDSCCVGNATVISANILCGPLPEPVVEENKPCNTCCVAGGVWSEWTSEACTDTCGSCGTSKKTRTCLSEPSCKCSGPTTRTEPCNIQPCVFPRDSCCNNLTAMAATDGTNQIICGPKETTFDPAPSTVCMPDCCPKYGVWSEWSAPTACGDTCGTSKQSRVRVCLSEGQGCPCVGPNKKDEYCSTTPCVFPRLSCNNNLKAMVINSNITCGPLTSLFDEVPTAPLTCNDVCCPKYGTWSEWTVTKPCGDVCGSCSTETRVRTCLDEDTCPCVGDKEETKICQTTPCIFPRDSCCSGYKAMVINKQIVCGPLPDADNENKFVNTCNNTCCPDKGMWSSWYNETSCGDTCGATSVVRQKRDCLSEAFGCSCTGDASRDMPCNVQPCTFPRDSCATGLKAGVYNKQIQCGPLTWPVDDVIETTTCCPPDGNGLWGQWLEWSTCDADACGGCNQKTRTRICESEKYGCPCKGSNTSTDYCNQQPCVSSEGKKTCCSPFSKALGPTGDVVCLVGGTLACPEDGTWSEWVDGDCNDTCGMCGRINRSRTCLTTAQGCDCIGSSTSNSTTACGELVCSYPRSLCCDGYTRKIVNKRFVCA